MSLTTYEDFLDLTVKQLSDYLSVRGLNTSGRKVELVAKAFAAKELNFDILESTEVQQKKLEANYAENLKKHNICDPLLIEHDKKIEDVTIWPHVTLGSVFAYILKKKDFDADYIGKYKDQKAFSFWDSGFVGPVLVHKLNRKIVFLYCDVTASQKINESKSLWIAVNIQTPTSPEILTAWCSCMAGAYESCNHVIACLYKIEFACRTGLIDPASTEKACEWNKSSKKQIEPRRISDLIVRKRLITDRREKARHTQERERMESLQSFDPRRENARCSNEIAFNNMLEKIKSISPESVIFKCVESVPSLQSCNPEEFNIQRLASDVLLCESSDATEANLITTFLGRLTMTTEQVSFIENRTRDQAASDLWRQLRLGRLTASKHHEILTKINTIARSSSLIRQKTTPLVASVLGENDDLGNIPSIKWGRDHEKEALKAFYALQANLHVDFKTEKSGLRICCEKPYIAATPDALMSCKCHGKLPIEIKCPFKMRGKTVEEGAKDCDFLTVSNGSITLKRTHKYFTQINSQMSLTGSKQGVFVVWTDKNVWCEFVDFDEALWKKLTINLDIFFKAYVCPALLMTKPVTFCGKCNKVLLEEREIDKKDEFGCNSILCDLCGSWFHYGCQNIKPNDLPCNTKVDWICIDCVISTSF